ncbi:hypothetical protein AAFP35_16915 [Gordonia sp. CPCC 206044]|uniref:hypothetical protein n=1 Tax=Gordonia sp. CPCC 206044 TaxID=3140793 RepID=UPI003AF3324B
MSISIIGAWAAREQSLDEVASATAKMLATWPGTGHWATPGETGNNDAVRYEPLDPSNVTDLTARIAASTAEIKNMKSSGQHLHITRLDADGQETMTLRIRAGFAKPRNRIVATVWMNDITSAESQRLIRGYMAALIGAWNPDWLEAGTYDFQKAQGHSHGQVIVGWDTYISDRIDFDDTAIDGKLATVRGAAGRYVTLDGTPAEPSLEQAQLVRTALGY